jgi:hypothetical protein
MSDHIPDAGKMGCPHCGAALDWVGTFCRSYACGSFFSDDASNRADQTQDCVTAEVNRITSERDQLRARVEELEAYVVRLEVIGDGLCEIAGKFGHGLFVHERKDAWAEAKQTKPKPEGLR